MGWVRIQKAVPSTDDGPLRPETSTPDYVTGPPDRRRGSSLPDPVPPTVGWTPDSTGWREDGVRGGNP